MSSPADGSNNASHQTVLDVGAEQFGKTYARALLGVTQAQNATDDVLAQLAEIVDEGIAKNQTLAAAFESPRIDAEEKTRVIDRLFGDVHPTLLKFMKVMAGRGRLGYLSAVRDAAESLSDDLSGRLVAEVRTAVAMTDSIRGEVSSQLSSKLGREVRLRESVDESLIGGMIVRVGDTVFDSSVASRLDKIGKAAAAGFARQLISTADRFANSD
ncbi:MAG: ATP synthase F1 subunit delta [Planctomycetota bacterium]